ncbi:hypothetical protein OJ997_11160 [Solirubrobacter phytolaccae]|uniref:DUF4878 domain-containing protein n=1 Tax=Solirubrobacter phytolaccae TaxID=1404360 RepID=A0A9X3N6V0_9ACTN|nr:hypothetical protein [Solirubrobacter phytolaccae]MDA0180853.1 hypothetical protein [Solirubrobacter phytolaccae]
MRRLIALALLSVACVACGDSAADERQIRATLDASQRAWIAQDVTKACTLMTAPARRAEAPCTEREPQEAAVVLLVGKAPPITDIDVDGDTAEVHRETGDPTRMRKLDGRWLID